MGKKRKVSGKVTSRSAVGETQPEVNTKFNVNEEFADSEDEFFAGRDRILLEEGPASKRRKKLEEDGMNFLHEEATF